MSYLQQVSKQVIEELPTVKNKGKIPGTNDDVKYMTVVDIHTEIKQKIMNVLKTIGEWNVTGQNMCNYGNSLWKAYVRGLLNTEDQIRAFFYIAMNSFSQTQTEFLGPGNAILQRDHPTNIALLALCAECNASASYKQKSDFFYNPIYSLSMAQVRIIGAFFCYQTQNGGLWKSDDMIGFWSKKMDTNTKWTIKSEHVIDKDDLAEFIKFVNSVDFTTLRKKRVGEKTDPRFTDKAQKSKIATVLSRRFKINLVMFRGQITTPDAVKVIQVRESKKKERKDELDEEVFFEIE
jgi:hypothetical protein